MYTNIDNLPLGNLLQISYGRSDKKKKKSNITKLRDSGVPNAPIKR